MFLLDLIKSLFSSNTSRSAKLDWVGAVINSSWDTSLVLQRMTRSVAHERLYNLTKAWSGDKCFISDHDKYVLASDERLSDQVNNLFSSDKPKERYEVELLMLLSRLYRDSCDLDFDKDESCDEIALNVIAVNFHPLCEVDCIGHIRLKDFNKYSTFNFLQKDGYLKVADRSILLRDIRRLHRYTYFCICNEFPLEFILLLNVLGCALALRYRIPLDDESDDTAALKLHLSYLIKRLTDFGV